MISIVLKCNLKYRKYKEFRILAGECSGIIKIINSYKIHSKFKKRLFHKCFIIQTKQYIHVYLIFLNSFNV